MKINNKKIIIGLLFLFIATVILWSKVLVAQEESGLDVFFYDVGQGDAIHIRNSENQDILIDGGPNSEIINKLGQNIPFYEDKIELVILTHPHEDHIAGLIHVLKKYNVEQILCSDINEASATIEEWNSIIKEKNINVKKAVMGQRIDFNQARMDILHPSINYKTDNVNNDSVVSRLVYGETSFIFTGDAEREAEEEILSNTSDINISSDVLKVGHHGSKSSSTKGLFSAINPVYGIISAGKDNKYNHPHEETLKKLEDGNIEIFRTDKDGDIRCHTDGKDVNCN